MHDRAFHVERDAIRQVRNAAAPGLPHAVERSTLSANCGKQVPALLGRLECTRYELVELLRPAGGCRRKTPGAADLVMRLGQVDAAEIREVDGRRSVRPALAAPGDRDAETRTEVAHSVTVAARAKYLRCDS